MSDVKRCDGTRVGMATYQMSVKNIHGDRFVQALVTVSRSGHYYPRSADLCGSCLDKQLQEWQQSGWPKDIVSIQAVTTETVEDDTDDD